jgi:hypothetical protein
MENYFYTDSKVVLCYIANESRRFHVFVANRVQQISQQWRHVSTKINPADLASRGLNATEMIDSDLWWKGPDFLRTNETLTTPAKDDLTLREDDPEVKKTPCVVLRTGIIPQVQASLLEQFKRFSSLFRLKRAVALCRRYLKTLKDCVAGKAEDQTAVGYQPVSVEEMMMAEQLIVRLTRKKPFLQSCLLYRRLSVVALYSALINLLMRTVFLRVGGRIKRCKLPASEKHPILLPHNSRPTVTSLLIENCHRKEGHAGRMTLNSTRQAGYWILGGRVVGCFSHNELCGMPEVERQAMWPEDGRFARGSPGTFPSIYLFSC